MFAIEKYVALFGFPLGEKCKTHTQIHTPVFLDLGLMLNVYHIKYIP